LNYLNGFEFSRHFIWAQRGVAALNYNDDGLQSAAVGVEQVQIIYSYNSVDYTAVHSASVISPYTTPTYSHA